MRLAMELTKILVIIIFVAGLAIGGTVAITVLTGRPISIGHTIDCGKVSFGSCLSIGQAETIGIEPVTKSVVKSSSLLDHAKWLSARAAIDSASQTGIAGGIALDGSKARGRLEATTKVLGRVTGMSLVTRLEVR